MSAEKQKREYPVGYGRPPLDKRFRSGQSGNPLGRRAKKKQQGTQNIATVLDELLSEPITVREGEKTRKITKREALVRAMLNAAINGNPTAISKIITLADEANLIGTAAEAEKHRGVIIVESGPSEGFSSVEEEVAYQQRQHREPKAS